MTTRQDLLVNQGETWSHVHTHLDSGGSPVDLTGHSARASVKGGYEGANEVYFSSGSDADGGSITLGGAAGTITLSMTAAQSAELAGDLTYFLFVEPEKRADRFVDFIYDLEIEDGSGTVTRVLEGTLRVQREVTS